jgi:hypothetical protein
MLTNHYLRTYIRIRDQNDTLQRRKRTENIEERKQQLEIRLGNVVTKTTGKTKT